jgi:hypothetical protein
MFRHNSGARVKDKSTSCRSFDTAWESYPGAVSPTLPVRPSSPLYGTVGKASVSSLTLCYPLSYGPNAAP